MTNEREYSQYTGNKHLSPSLSHPELPLRNDTRTLLQHKEPLPLEGVLDSIRAMTAKVRLAQGFGEQPDTGEGWWVLAVGEDLDGVRSDKRDHAREILRQQVENAGVLLAEYVWVWDDARQAQLVIATFPSLARARRVAKRLRTKGLTIRVTRETL